MTPHVLSLFIKKVRGTPVVPVKEIQVIERYGINDDANMNPASPRHVLLTSKETLDHFSICPGDLKENIVTKGLDLDNLESGTVLQIGEAQIRITINCEPCRYVETIRKGLAKDIRGYRGKLGVIIKSGGIKINDQVSVLSMRFTVIPDNIEERFNWLLSQIPAGKVITSTQIIQALGLFRVYYRVIPSYLKKSLTKGLPVHRVVDSERYLLEQLKFQRDLLLQEHVEINEFLQVALKNIWDTSNIYYMQK